MEAHRCNINPRSSVILLLLLVSLAASSLLPPSASPDAVADSEKVELSLYYEALCPTSANFIVTYLNKILDNGLISIVDLKLSPYGNAWISSNGTIVCQHGEWECMLNTVEACAIHTWPLVSDHFPFIYCVESLVAVGKYAEWETCFQKLNLNPKPVTDCYNSGFGYELDLQYANETSALEPPHTYVPWVVVEGQPIHNDYADFMSYVCDAYKGSNVPQACLDLSEAISTQNSIAKPLNPVCYKEEDYAKSKSTISEIISATLASWMQHFSKA